MNMEIYSIVNTFITIFLGGGWFLHWRAHKRQENAKASQEEAKANQEAATAEQQKADAFKSMQDAYQQMHEDLLGRLKEVCEERDHYRNERDEERRANKELRQKQTELDERMTQMDLQYKRDISRLERRIDVLSPFLCGAAGCMHRSKISIMENIDDNSFAADNGSSQDDVE